MKLETSFHKIHKNKVFHESEFFGDVQIQYVTL